LHFPRKIIMLFIGLLFTISLTGCGEKQEQKEFLKAIKERSKLIVGVKYDAKPFGFLDEDEQVKGFDIDLCREIAYRLLGNKSAIEFKQVTSSNRIFSITSGSVDFVAATMTITPKRQQVIDFSNPYYIAGQAVMVPQNSDIKTLGDLAGKKIIVSLGSTSEMNIRRLFPTAEILGFRTYTDAFSALRAERGDALTTDDTIIYGFLSENPDFIMLKDRLTEEPYALGFKKGRETETLRETINNVLNEMARDGTIAQLEEKWTRELENTENTEAAETAETAEPATSDAVKPDATDTVNPTTPNEETNNVQP